MLKALSLALIGRYQAHLSPRKGYGVGDCGSEYAREGRRLQAQHARRDVGNPQYDRAVDANAEAE